MRSANLDTRSGELFDRGFRDLETRFDPEVSLVRSAFQPDRHQPHPSIWYAHCLFDRDGEGDVSLAEQIILRALDLQERRDGDPHAGNFRWRLAEWAEQTKKTGAPHEFNSPTYSAVQINTLATIAQFAQDDEIRNMAVEMEHNYEGPPKVFWEYPSLAGPFFKSSVRNGFALWVASRADFDAVEAFGAALRKTPVSDEMTGSVRQIELGTGSEQLTLEYDLKELRL
jgi:hypothetical protein